MVASQLSGILESIKFSAEIYVEEDTMSTRTSFKVSSVEYDADENIFILKYKDGRERRYER